MPYSVEADLLSTTVIAVPFVAFIMSVLHKQQVLQDKLTHLASTDMLTGLPNRRAFLAHTTALTRGGQSGAVSRGRANRGH